MSHGIKKNVMVTLMSLWKVTTGQKCELAGLFMLNELSKSFDKDNIGLYRDDGLLSVFKNHNDHQDDKVWKEMMDLLKQHHLNVEIKCYLKIVDYIYITSI